MTEATETKLYLALTFVGIWALMATVVAVIEFKMLSDLNRGNRVSSPAAQARADCYLQENTAACLAKLPPK